MPKKDNKNDNWEKLPDEELEKWKETGEVPKRILDVVEEASKTKKKASKKPSAKVVDQKIRQQVVKEEKAKLKKEAEKLALQLQTQAQLENAVELSDVEKDAALFRAMGFSMEETAQKTGLTLSKIKSLHKLPAWVHLMNENTIKEGLSDKNERIRGSKRILEGLQNKLIEKIGDEDAMNALSIGQLTDMFMKVSQRLDSLVDKKEDVTAKRDVTVLILNHVQGTTGKQFKDIDEMFDQYKYDDIIDVEADEV